MYIVKILVNAMNPKGWNVGDEVGVEDPSEWVKKGWVEVLKAPVVEKPKPKKKAIKSKKEVK